MTRLEVKQHLISFFQSSQQRMKLATLKLYVDKAADPAIGRASWLPWRVSKADVSSLRPSSSNHSLLRWILSLSEMAKMELFLELSFRFQAESRYGEAEFLAFTG